MGSTQDLMIDGEFGPATARAVDRLQDNDCTAIHFALGDADVAAFMSLA